MKCEACGYENGKSYNPTKRIISLLEERGDNNCQKKLKEVIKLIRNELPSDRDNQKTFYFLQAISKISNDIIERAIHIYKINEHVYEGKGFAYLKQMIISENINRDKMLNNEIKRFGRTPRKVEVERGEYKNVYKNK